MPDTLPRTQSADLPPVRIRVRRPQEPQISSTPTEIRAPASATSSDYEVGYGKPPRHSRFARGRSGNPKGRPKGAKSLNTIVRENMTQKVSVRTPTGERRISRIEALMHKAVEQAMKGNPRALAEMLKLYGNAVPDERANATGTHDRDGDLTAADFAILEALREELLREREVGDDAP